MQILKDRRILLCVSGGIAIYKSLELVRLLKKMGARVRVAMSEEAKKFITPLSFEAISGEIVLHSQTESWAQNGANHISYASWAEVCVLAPASMNSMSKFAYGMADNVMLSTLLALQCPVIIAPSANTNMYLSSQAQAAFALLQERGVEIVQAREDLLACGVYGIGAMQEPFEIAYRVARVLLKGAFWGGKKVVISGGGSEEGIDEVRCLSNYSSGISASYFALALYLLGAEVSFVSSKTPIPLPHGIKIIKALSAQDFLKEINAEIKCAQKEVYYFGIAAICDFIPTQMQKGKIKKTPNLTLELKENIDVLKSIEGCKKIGFKAEKDEKQAQSCALKMLEDKKCDFVCLNVLRKENDFGSNQNEIILLSKNEKILFPMQDKFSLALAINQEIEKLSRD